MRMPRIVSAAALVVAAALPLPAAAVVQPGNTAPNFQKEELDSPAFGQTTTRTLADYQGKVILFFLLGYN
jgi:hypothetical protein